MYVDQDSSFYKTNETSDKFILHMKSYNFIKQS